MKAKYALIALLAITFFGCDDNTGGLGLGMFPGNDQNIKGKLSTFDVTTKSIPTGKIYAKTNIGYVGKFTDETFGTYQAGFLAQLNCPDGLTFPEVYTEETDASGKVISATGKMVITNEDDETIEIIKDDQGNPIGNIRTTELFLLYDNYFGDSLTACRLSVYELGGDNKETLNTDNAYYTNIIPEEFYDSQNLLGTKAYTAVDYSLSEEDRNSSTYVPYIHVAFKEDRAKEVGKNILEASRAAGKKFNNQLFGKAFPGIYVKSDYGDGTVLYVDQVQMRVVYKCYATDSITGIKLKKQDGVNDSTYYTWRQFASTREIIQANQLSNDEQAINERINEKTCTYLKSPAGIFTEATLPISDIENELTGDTLNAVKLTFTNYNQSSDKKFGMSTPRNVLLIRKKYKDSFFKDNQLSDGITSSLFNPTTTSFTQYTFNNITQMINDCLADGEREEAEKKFKNGGTITLQITDAEGNVKEEPVDNIVDWERLSDWNKFILIPVLVTTDSSSSNNYYGSSSNVISIQHDLKPGYARLKGGTNATNISLDKEQQDKYKLKLEVVSTNFGTKSK